MGVYEVENGGVLETFLLQLSVRHHIGCHKRWCGYPSKILGVFLLVHEFGAWHPQQFDADAHEADVINVRCDVGARPGEPHPGAKCLRFGEYAVAEFLRQVRVHDEFGTHDAMRFWKVSMMESTKASSPGSCFSWASARPSLVR